MLSDGDKRAAYDRYGHEAVDGSAEGFGGQGGADFSDIFGDVFGDIFVAADVASKGRHRADLRYQMELSLEEAARRRENRIPTMVGCKPDLNRRQRGSKFSTCGTCTGMARFACSRIFLGSANLSTVPRTRSSLKIPHQLPGSRCNRRNQNLSVKIPAGVDTGDRIRLAGEGEAAPMVDAPEIYVQVAVKQHPIFERDGKHPTGSSDQFRRCRPGR